MNEKNLPATGPAPTTYRVSFSDGDETFSHLYNNLAEAEEAKQWCIENEGNGRIDAFTDNGEYEKFRNRNKEETK